MSKNTRHDRIKSMLFGKARFKSDAHEFLVTTLHFVFLGLAAFVFLETIDCRKYFFGFGFLIFMPVFALNAWAIWKDSNDGVS